MTATRKIIILGGAIMGSMTALFLRREGFTGPITVIEKDPSYQFASTALSAAAIRTQFGTPLNVRMSLFGAAFFRSIRTQLGPEADIGYTEGGYLILGAPDSVAAREQGRRIQTGEGADIEALGPEALGRKFPFLNTGDLGIGTFGRQHEGWFDAWLLLSATRARARRLDVDYLTAEVTAFLTGPRGVHAAVLADGTALACDDLVLAAGPASGRLMRLLGEPLPVEPRKRTVFSFKAPVPAAGFPMLFDTSGLWIRPEGEGFIGGIQPPADNDPDATGDFEPDHALFEDVYWPLLAHRIPAMEQLRLERAWAGHYEVNTLDHNGIVGPHDRIANLHLITGFSGHGVMHAPAAGRALAEWLVHGEYRSLNLGALGYGRIRRNEPLTESVVY